MKICGSLYFDYQASAPVDPEVQSAMEPYWRDSFGNPHSSIHSVGWAAAAAVRDAQSKVARLIGADADEIVFTSGATEANNLALLGLARRAQSNGRSRILVSAIEHKCVLEAARVAGEQFGLSIETIPVHRDGRIDYQHLESVVDDDVFLISVMAVNNEVGVIQDLVMIASLAKQRGAIVHTDAAQAPCAFDLSGLADLVDLASLSAHKMYGPQGIGALYVRRELQDQIEPQIRGGGQQAGMRSGTMPVALIVGMGHAAKMMQSSDALGERERIHCLRDRFVEALCERIPGTMLNGPENAIRHPGNASLCFPNVAAEDLLLAVQPRLAASTGSACTTGIPEPSHVLCAMGLSASEAESSIRFGLGRFTDETMVNEAVDIIVAAYVNLCGSLAAE